MNKVISNKYFLLVVCGSLLAVTLLICSCGEDTVNPENDSASLSLKIVSPVTSYSVVGEVLKFHYRLTNNGNVALAGTVEVADSLMSVDCPELIDVGNNEGVLKFGESIVCSSIYIVTQDDFNAKHIVNSARASVGGVSSNLDSVTINNIAESLFIFPFDTSDPSVVFRSSLTSAYAILNNGGVEGDGALNEFDEVLGMKPGTVVGGSPGCYFTSSSIAELASLPSGQLSLEVEREWLAITDASVGSVGYNRNSIEYLLSYGASDMSAHGLIMMQTNGTLISQFSPLEVLRSAHYVNTNQSDRFVRLTISWTPAESRLYVDGLPLARVKRADQAVDHFSNIFVGSFGGADENSMKSNYYVRNLIVSSRPVVATTTEPLLQHVMHIGDSFAAGQPLFNNAPKYDGTIVNTVIRELFTNGFAYEKYTVYSNGGGKIQDFSNDPLELDVTNGGGKTRAEALADDPSLVVFITGGNDLGIFQSDLFSIDLHDHIEAFLGVNGHQATHVEYVIVTTTTSSSFASSDNLIAMREIMLNLPNWWDATYPDMSGRVHVLDTWNLFGGNNVDLSLFGSIDSVHPSAGGNIVYGKAIAEKIMELVNL